MVNFFVQNSGSIIVGAIVLAILILVIRKLIRDAKSGNCSSCGGCGGCANCKMNSNCESRRKDKENK